MKRVLLQQEVVRHVVLTFATTIASAIAVEAARATVIRVHTPKKPTMKFGFEFREDYRRDETPIA